MKLNPFIKIYKRGKRICLFNPLTLERFYFKEDEFNDMENSKSFNELVEKEFLVKDDFDEKEYFDRIREAIIGYDKYPNISLMYLLLTEDCNYDCKYCFIEPKIREKNLMMTKEIAKKGIDLYLRNLGSGDYHEVWFYGGEPLMNFDVMKFSVEYVRGRLPNVRLTLITNGSLISDDVADFLVKNNINVGLSLDGPKEINDNYRYFYKTDRGTFDATLLGYKKLKERGLKLGVSCVVNKYNYDKLEEITEYFIKELGFNGIGFNLMREMNEDKAPNPREVAKHMIKSFEICHGEGINEDRIGNRRFKSFINKRPWIKDCAGYGNQIVVTPNGKIGTCHAFWPENRYLDLDVNFNESICNNKNWIEWNNRLAYNLDDCKNCEGISLCGGGCAFSSFMSKGSLYALDEYTCEFVKEVLEWLIWHKFYDTVKVYGKNILIKAPTYLDRDKYEKFFDKRMEFDLLMEKFYDNKINVLFLQDMNRLIGIVYDDEIVLNKEYDSLRLREKLVKLKRNV